MCDDGCALGFCKQLIITDVNATATDVDEHVDVDLAYQSRRIRSTWVGVDVNASIAVDAAVTSDPIKMTFLASFAWDKQECTSARASRDPRVVPPAEKHADSGSRSDGHQGVGGDVSGDVACVPRNNGTVVPCRACTENLP